MSQLTSHARLSPPLPTHGAYTPPMSSLCTCLLALKPRASAVSLLNGHAVKPLPSVQTQCKCCSLIALTANKPLVISL